MNDKEQAPELADLRVEPKEYFKFVRSQNQHLSKRESDGQAGASFSCTTMRMVTQQTQRELTNDEMRKAYIDLVKSRQSQGLVLMLTSEGQLRLLVHCDKTPKTCENFLELCQSGAYNNLTFHRLIPGFMVQGGCPEGTGKGGKAYFDKSELSSQGGFKDEFHPSLIHDKRGLLAMANSGPHTNRSQFYITFGVCRHLDNKHSIFAEIDPDSADSLATLERIEKIGHGSDTVRNRPTKKITIAETTVVVNPFRDAIAKLLQKHWSQSKSTTSTSIASMNSTGAPAHPATSFSSTWASMSSKNVSKHN